MKENFKVGEKVRLLHHKGEGIVQRLISPTRIEVLIDDFYEMEVGVGEIVRINAAAVVGFGGYPCVAPVLARRVTSLSSLADLKRDITSTVTGKSAKRSQNEL